MVSSQVEQDGLIVLGGDFNCAVETGGVSGPVRSAGVLRNILTDYDLIGTWSVKHQGKKCHVNISPGNLFTANSM